MDEVNAIDTTRLGVKKWELQKKKRKREEGHVLFCKWNSYGHQGPLTSWWAPCSKYNVRKSSLN